MARQREGLVLRQQQRLTLTPEMRTTLSVLRMSGGALRDLLEAQAAENPILSVKARYRDTPAGAMRGPSAFDVALDTTSAALSLGDQLRAQLGLMDLPTDVHQAALALSWSLSDSGYLDSDPDEIATELGLPGDTIAAGLVALQSCDPPGVGARSLAECLALQLVERGLERDVAERATTVLDKLAAGDFKRAAKITDLPSTALRQVAALLPDLLPFPGQSLQPAPRDSTPDVEVRLPGDTAPEIVLLRGTPEDLTLDTDLMAAARQEENTALARYGAQAEALHRAVAYRGRTLLRIVAHLVEYQSAFFRDGAQSMRPLTRDKLAETLALHPSTVGRAVADKVLAYPGGAIPLSAFFSARLGQSSQDRVSAYGVQAQIAALIANETQDTILTDTEIAHKLKDEGVDIARRTVAKYRGCLNIPSSYDRKRLRAASRMRGRAPQPG